MSHSNYSNPPALIVSNDVYTSPNNSEATNDNSGSCHQ